MTAVFCDTETTGLEPENSAPFEIALLVYRDGVFLAESLYHLNPLCYEDVLVHEGALKINGATEELIRSYPSAVEVIPEIVKFLCQFKTPEKLVFAGYNAEFDYIQIGGLFFRYGAVMSDIFNGRLVDVLELVKKGKAMNFIGPTKNNKLETITEALGIPHDEAHTAMSDIKATRKVFEHISFQWKKARGEQV